MNKNKRVPTSAELNILNVLWRIQPATVRKLHDHISETQKIGYTTVLKMLQIMHEKGLVTRDESTRAHVYSAANSVEQTQSSLLSDIVNKAFGGSRFDLVMRALGDEASSKEINEIRTLLDSLEKNNK
ncbi:BlaI/MecI/CopY family transcriptional regulator [Pseudoalteromonas piratica]|uniref:Transcriptional regulator n=1 Tax=Pseudoalteromonas piratica TaxID=1348114 RepID=A0A0A7EHR4_9GAMM|nr:BlaI/MecI/CopY family transcriptional regulator [Pseudoalteromonas piratica]AIY66159.1 transcriptional regulator [Pseudoalteromonas piratica]